MHPKNYGKGQGLKPDPEARDPCDHEPGERLTVVCVTCESEEQGEIEAFGEGVCWRCDECGGAMDLSVVA